MPQPFNLGFSSLVFKRSLLRDSSPTHYVCTSNLCSMLLFPYTNILDLQPEAQVNNTTNRNIRVLVSHHTSRSYTIETKPVQINLKSKKYNIKYKADKKTV